MRRAPRAERRPGVVAGFGVDEERAVGVERDGQLEREVASGAAAAPR